MKKLQYHILVLLLLCICTVGHSQGTDQRNRVASTIIADGLAQLPANNVETFNQVMEEMAQTGADGIKSLVGLFGPISKGANAAYEYAVNGVVDYVTRPDKANLRAGVKEGLIQALRTSKDQVLQAFLITQIQKLATAADVAVFEAYLNDSYLQPFAMSALATTPGIDQYLIGWLPKSNLPKQTLAHLITTRQLVSPALEPMLLSWIPGADSQTLNEIYKALVINGSTKAAKVLGKQAKSVGYQYEPTHATDAYMQLLTHLASNDPKWVGKAAKQLVKQQRPAIRCAALELLLKTSGSKATSEVLKALKDKDVQYRNTALAMAEECAGNGIFKAVSNQIDRLSVPAQIDVVRWLGNNKQQNFIEVVLKKMMSSNDELSNAAIHAASQIGGPQALQGLMALLGGPKADQALQVLKSFKGSIQAEALKALGNSNASVQAQALKLIAERRMYQAYDEVLRLTSSQNAVVKTAAYEALGSISDYQHFEPLCEMLERADAATAPHLQKAALYALHQQSSAEQFAAIQKRLDKTNHLQLYYPMLAQAGNQQAIRRLVIEFHYQNPSMADEAFNSLLKIDNESVIDVLDQIASTTATRKDQALKRALTLTKRSSLNGMERYLLYRRALEMNPSVSVVNSYLSALGSIYELPALTLAAKYLDKKENAYQAATVVKTIIGKNKALQGGETIKTWLNKAKDIFSARTEDADAGYAIDEIKGLLGKWQSGGFMQEVVDGKCIGKASVGSGDTFENVDLYVDWRTKGKGMLYLRSMPEVVLDGTTGAQFVHAADSKLVAVEQNAKPGEWNTLHVRLVNDRLLIESNGRVVAENVIIKNTPTRLPIKTVGQIFFMGGEEEMQIRNLMIHKLPSTPVFTLSKEEKEEGYEVLFDGRSLDKWEGNLINYVPVDGNIYVSAKYGAGGNLYSKKKYSDFIYRFEFSFVKPGVNNGIGIRTKHGVDAAYDGMEIQVLDHDDPIYKGLHDYQQHGAVYGIIVPKHVKFGPLGTWNVEEIRAIGDRITVTVNGEVILDGNIREACQGHNVAPDGGKVNPYTVDKKNHPGLFNKDGYISFCGHGEGVKFRNVRILDLSKNKKTSKSRTRRR